MIWTITPEWRGETAFIVAGGPSVAAYFDGAGVISCLNGRRVIAVNSSWQCAPFADVLFFGDQRWWHEYESIVLGAGFAGRIATCAPGVSHLRLSMLKKIACMERLPHCPDTVMMRRTSLTAAMCVAAHLGVAEIVLLGADGRATGNGRTHHHAPYPWNQRTGCWDEQKADLLVVRDALTRAGIHVRNASPATAWADLWPVVDLANMLGRHAAPQTNTREDAIHAL